MTVYNPSEEAIELLVLCPPPRDNLSGILNKNEITDEKDNYNMPDNGHNS